MCPDLGLPLAELTHQIQAVSVQEKKVVTRPTVQFRVVPCEGEGQKIRAPTPGTTTPSPAPSPIYDLHQCTSARSTAARRPLSGRRQRPVESSAKSDSDQEPKQDSFKAAAVSG